MLPDTYRMLSGSPSKGFGALPVGALGGSQEAKSQLRPKHHGASSETNGCRQSRVGCLADMSA